MTSDGTCAAPGAPEPIMSEGCLPTPLILSRARRTGEAGEAETASRAGVCATHMAKGMCAWL